MVEMYLPPQIVIVPGLQQSRTSKNNDGRLLYMFPMPASQQPQILRDPRVTDAFESMAWSEKSKALLEYASKVEFWYSSITAENEQIRANFNTYPCNLLASSDSAHLACVFVLCVELDVHPFLHWSLSEEDFYQRSRSASTTGSSMKPLLVPNQRLVCLFGTVNIC